MNRKYKRSLILLPLSLGVVGLFAGREIASWRPVKVARFPSIITEKVRALSISNHAVAQATGEAGTLFDTQSRKLQNFSFSEEDAVGVQKDFFWRTNASPFSLELTNKEGHKRIFVHGSSIDVLNNRCLRVLPEQNRVVLLDKPDIYQWDFQNQHLRRQVEFDIASEGSPGGTSALSRDGRTFIHANEWWIRVGNVSDGKFFKTTLIQVDFHPEGAHLSPYGRYVLLDRSGDATKCEVVNSATGKRLWSFYIPPNASSLWTISDDETTIVTPTNTTWEVHDLHTGAILRRLPLVPGVTVAALSPDGKALYSVAKGVLYRQRAR